MVPCLKQPLQQSLLTVSTLPSKYLSYLTSSGLTSSTFKSPASPTSRTSLQLNLTNLLCLPIWLRSTTNSSLPQRVTTSPLLLMQPVPMLFSQLEFCSFRQYWETLWSFQMRDSGLQSCTQQLSRCVKRSPSLAQPGSSWQTFFKLFLVHEWQFMMMNLYLVSLLRVAAQDSKLDLSQKLRNQKPLVAQFVAFHLITSDTTIFLSALWQYASRMLPTAQGLTKHPAVNTTLPLLSSSWTALLINTMRHLVPSGLAETQYLSKSEGMVTIQSLTWSMRLQYFLASSYFWKFFLFWTSSFLAMNFFSFSSIISQKSPLYSISINSCSMLSGSMGSSSEDSGGSFCSWTKMRDLSKSQSRQEYLIYLIDCQRCLRNSDSIGQLIIVCFRASIQQHHLFLYTCLCQILRLQAAKTTVCHIRIISTDLVYSRSFMLSSLCLFFPVYQHWLVFDILCSLGGWRIQVAFEHGVGWSGQGECLEWVGWVVRGVVTEIGRVWCVGGGLFKPV